MSALQNPFLLPSFPKQPNPNGCIRFTFNVSHLQELVLASKSKKMCKQRIEVRLRAQMQDLWVVRIVYMCEDAEKLPVDVLDSCGEGLMKGLIWKAMVYGL
jgi:hypothetical protein